MSTELSSILLAAAEELAGVQVGPGSLSRACREAQRTILSSRPPLIPGGVPNRPSKYNRPRSNPLVRAR